VSRPHPGACAALTNASDKEEPISAANGDAAPADKAETTKEPEVTKRKTEEPEEPASSAQTKEEPAQDSAKPSDAAPQPNSNEPTASGALIPDSETTEKPHHTSEAQQEDKPAEPAPAQDNQAQEKPVEQTQPEPAQSQQQVKPDPPQTEAAPATNGEAVEPKARDDKVPSSILEKGIVYFFFRARVNVSDPQDVNDIARSYMILRPLPKGAKLGEGPIGDEGNCRLLAIPKKVLPLSGKDRFMSFVEGAKKSFADLKSEFLSSNDYATKTSGTSHSPPATPLAEGVYAITTTGRESHFAYMTTIPSELGEVQKDVGIKEQGSFVVSAKNPKFPGPANASLGKDPGYPQEIVDEFRDLRWMPLQPKLLDYVNTQFLLIGESGGVDKALEGLPRDEKKGMDAPKDEMEKLEGEDEIRVKHLQGEQDFFYSDTPDSSC
jgi:hypothetical protein